MTPSENSADTTRRNHKDDGEDEEEVLWWTTKQPMSLASPTGPGYIQGTSIFTTFNPSLLLLMMSWMDGPNETEAKRVSIWSTPPKKNTHAAFPVTGLIRSWDYHLTQVEQKLYSKGVCWSPPFRSWHPRAKPSHDAFWPTCGLVAHYSLVWSCTAITFVRCWFCFR